MTAKAILWPRANRVLPPLAVAHLSDRQLRQFSDVFLHRRAPGSVHSPLLLAQFYSDLDSAAQLRLVDHSARLRTFEAPHPALLNATLMKTDRVLPYTLRTERLSCSNGDTGACSAQPSTTSLSDQSCVEAFAPFAYLVTEGLREESLVVNVTATRIRVDSLTPVSSHLVLLADPACTYRTSLGWELGASIGAVMHAYISELVGFVFVVLLLTLARISKSWEESGTHLVPHARAQDLHDTPSHDVI